MEEDSSPPRAPEAPKRLLVVLTVSPLRPRFATFLHLLRKALQEGVEIYLYCLDEGVEAVTLLVEETRGHPNIRIAACAYGAARRGIVLPSQILPSGLGTLARWLRLSKDCQAV